MKIRKMATNIGVINFAEFELAEDELDILIPVTTVSNRLKATIDENIQKAKEKYQKKYLDEKGKRWSDAGIIMNYQDLHIIIGKEKKFTYRLNFWFTDKEDNSIETGFAMDVDLAKYKNKLKKGIVRAMINKYF